MDTVLTRICAVLITVFLGLLVLQSLTEPEPATAQVTGESAFAAVEFLPTERSLWFFDRRTGDLWIYDQQRQLPFRHYKLEALGAPLAKVKLEPTAKPEDVKK